MRVPTVDAVTTNLTIALFHGASFLTDPICKSHEFYRRLYFVDAMHPKENAISRCARKFFIFLGFVGYSTVATVTTIPGIALRGILANLQKHPYIYERGHAAEKVLPADGTFTLLSWNICCMVGGWVYSHAGLVPWAFRIDRIIDKIVETNADVVCLNETFDTTSALYLAERLKEKGYVHFYFNIGPRSLGVSSGIFIASKFAIAKPKFTFFPEDSHVGWSKSSSKGVFAFDLVSQGKSFSRVHSTHLQYSEECAFPTPEEVEGRKKQMELIVKKVEKVRPGKCVVVNGDLNLDDREYYSSSWHTRFQKGDHFVGKTWGGDKFCNRVMGKKPSRSLNLDHVMVLEGTARSIHTTLIETGFHGKKYRRRALSDHRGLLTRIRILTPSQRGV